MMTLDSWKNVILRPLALFSLSFFLVSCAVVPVGGARLLLPSAVFLVLSAVFALLSLIFVKNRKALRSFFAVFMLFFGIFSALFSSYLNFTKNIEPYIALDGKEVYFSGTVTDIIYSKPYAALYTVRTDTLEGKVCAVNTYLYGEHGFDLGDKVRAKAKITALTDVNGAPTEEGRYGYSDGIVISAEATETEYTGSTGFDLSRAAKNIRSYVSEKLMSVLGDRSGGFCAALITGDRSHLPADIHRDFKALGISHILALSGMHLSVICTLIYALTKHLSIHIRRLSVACVVVFYMLLTGFSPSVTRAGIMLLTALFANMLRRGGDMVTSIGIAAFLICIIDPFAPGDVGLQLSVAAVFAIALATGAAKRKEPKKGTVREKGLRYSMKRFAKAALSALYVCVCVNIFLLPLEWLYFAFISPAAPFVSVIISFLATLLLFLLPFLILSFPVAALSAAIAFPVKLLCKTIFLICAGLSDIPNITVSILYPGALFMCIVAVLAFIVFAVTKKRVKAVSGIVCIAVFFALVGGGYIYSALTGERALIDYINCGKSDAVTV
ncbi:MAG: ComEC/Rec2 family competence protein, partial [Clostridia bacterium]|nr:ComEC/Rec2 family competence protein [Clostridia bacterium]